MYENLYTLIYYLKKLSSVFSLNAISQKIPFNIYKLNIDVLQVILMNTENISRKLFT